MKSIRPKIIFIAAALFCASSVSAIAFAQEKADKTEPLKIGFVYVSPIDDAGWTYQHNLARIAIEEKFGNRIQTKYIENVPEGVDAERVIHDLAQSGHKLIFTTSFGFMNPTLKAANQFPENFFEHATGFKTAKNMGFYNARFYEGRYLAGILAGKMTKTNVAGYVAAYPIPEVLMGINAFTRGMRSVNPNAQTKVVWTHSWYDPDRAREAANALISQGADILTHHSDSPAVAQAAEAGKVYVIAYHSDMSKVAPNMQLAAVTHHWENYYTRVVQSVLSGTWKSDQVWGGVKDGFIKLGPIHPAVPANVVALLKAAEADIASGKRHPFTGPMLDNEGKERLARGQTITDETLLKMDYYVEGVQGKLPVAGQESEKHPHEKP
ncbi:MAG: BMP family ABC transporter substrate-binding protein [Burkholderiales bacterium]|jgi:simple sugar transport system substrate-binding protein|nr:BMP family ABC transporter substrate-binding protein [Burkholderiales bacterium]